MDGYNITNAYKPGKVSIQVTKAWVDGNDQDGKRPESIKVHLYADGKDTGKELELTKNGNWSGSFTDLDEYQDGKKIEYTVKEDEVEGYTSEVTGDAVEGYVVTNTHIPEQPKTPKNPDTPSNPGTPGQPENPKGAKSQQNIKKAAKTGDVNSEMTWAIINLSCLGIALAAYKRKRSER